jgi:hypothetical protein
MFESFQNKLILVIFNPSEGATQTSLYLLFDLLSGSAPSILIQGLDIGENTSGKLRQHLLA